MIRTLFIVSFIGLSGIAAVHAEQQELDQRVHELLEQLSSDEKISLLTGIGFTLDQEPLEGTDRFIPGVAGYTRHLPEHGLPSLLLSDGPAGLRLIPSAEGHLPATAFPVATLLASSWDLDLVREVGVAMGTEAHAYGIDIILGPGMNLQRDPLGGRNYEYYSEDPLLSGRLAAAMVSGIQSTGTGATLKHFVANNQETNRTTLNTLVDERTLRELYLRGFEIAVRESQPAAIMTAYNLLNGTHTSESGVLNHRILRQEWGFNGIVMTDWFAGEKPADQIIAGHNLLMPGIDRDREALSSALEDGSPSQDMLDFRLRPLLRAIVGQEEHGPALAGPNNAVLAKHASLARRAASEGAVLLKNEGNTLPLSDNSATVALYGTASYNVITGGTGSGDVAELYSVSPAEGMANAGCAVLESLANQQRSFIATAEAERRVATSMFERSEPLPELVPNEANLREHALKADFAIVTVGRSTGEFIDRTQELDFALQPEERELMTKVSRAFRTEGKPIIAILNVGGPVDLASWIEDVDAVLVSWLGGQEAGNAIADVLVGRTNPSGKLTMSWPISYSDTPTAQSFPGVLTATEPVSAYAGFGQSVPSEVAYTEGLNVGYRASGYKPLFPFGYGLSFTTFEISVPVLEQTGSEIVVTLVVSNTGSVAGAAVVQLYVSAPDEELEKPQKELRSFAKTKVLQPGKQETLRFKLTPSDLSSYDPDLGAWITHVGSYDILLGSSVEHIEQQISFTIDEQWTKHSQ